MGKEEKNPLLRNAYTYLLSCGIIKNKGGVAIDLKWPRASNSNYLNGKRTASQQYLDKFAAYYNIDWADFNEYKTPVKLQSVRQEDVLDALYTKISDLENAVAFLISLQLGNDPEKIKAARDLLGPLGGKIQNDNG